MRREAQHTHTSRKKPILWLTNQVVFSLEKRTIIYASMEEQRIYMYSKEKAEYKKRKLSHKARPGKCSFCSLRVRIFPLVFQSH